MFLVDGWIYILESDEAIKTTVAPSSTFDARTVLEILRVLDLLKSLRQSFIFLPYFFELRFHCLVLLFLHLTREEQLIILCLAFVDFNLLVSDRNLGISLSAI